MASPTRPYLTYFHTIPTPHTFQDPATYHWIHAHIIPPTLNLFSGHTPLPDATNVDLDPTSPADHHVEALTFVTTTTNTYRTVILDPPYSLRQARRLYQGRHVSDWKALTTALRRILLPSPRLITFGYNSLAIPGFTITAIAILRPGTTNGHDIIATVQDQGPQLW